MSRLVNPSKAFNSTANSIMFLFGKNPLRNFCHSFFFLFLPGNGNDVREKERKRDIKESLFNRLNFDLMDCESCIYFLTSIFS